MVRPPQIFMWLYTIAMKIMSKAYATHKSKWERKRMRKYCWKRHFIFAGVCDASWIYIVFGYNPLLMGRRLLHYLYCNGVFQMWTHTIPPSTHTHTHSCLAQNQMTPIERNRIVFHCIRSYVRICVREMPRKFPVDDKTLNATPTNLMQRQRGTIKIVCVVFTNTRWHKLAAM